MINQQQIDFFNDNGYLRYGRVLDMAEVEALRAGLDRVIAIEEAGGDESEIEFQYGHRRGAPKAADAEAYRPRRIVQYVNMFKREPLYERLLHHPVISGVAGALLDTPRVRLWHDQIISKPPEENGHFHFHQDFYLWPLREPRILTCWLALDDATPENGCLQVAPKSHREGIALHCTIDNQLGIPDKFIEQEQARPVPLNPGGVLFFHPMCKHGSLDNKSDAFRWSFDLRYNPIGQATGRPHFPGFIAQSRANPESELADHREWAKLWLEARSNLAEVTEIKHNRWNKDDPLCA